MKDKELKQFSNEVLNFSGVRGALRKKLSQIDKLESLDSLKGLRLTRMDIGEGNPLFIAVYEATASNELYPNIKSNLISKDVIKKQNVLDYKVENEGRANESKTLRFGISGNYIQVVLKAYKYNQHYK